MSKGTLAADCPRHGFRGMSIGYKAIETERRKEDGARLLTGVGRDQEERAREHGFHLLD